jgi:putative SOS response-associated peptidase YedK
MCSNYSQKKDEAKLKLRDKMLVFGAVPRANIRPTDLGPVILPEQDEFVCREMRWGWKVPWDESPLINAKSETLTTLATFKKHLNQRCLLLADGFFEKGVFFHQPAGQTFCLAGLWRDEPNGQRYVMLTATPNATVAPYHQRMPLIVPPEFYDAWLGDDWQRVIAEPDRSPLEKVQRQPELF